MGGPGSDSAYELLPFGLSAYGGWMRHTQRWVKSLAGRAVDARQGRDAFAVSTDYLVGPLLVKLAAGVAVTRINGNLICIQGAVATRAPEEKLDEHPKEDAMDIFDIFQTQPLDRVAFDDEAGEEADRFRAAEEARVWGTTPRDDASWRPGDVHPPPIGWGTAR